MNGNETIIRIDLSWACFGLVAVDGRIVDAAPIARWCIGRRQTDVIAYWRRRGATVTVLEEI